MTQNQIAYFNAKVQERHFSRLDDETKRHNQRTEELTGASNQYTREHYERSDSESQRHNRAAEQISQAQTDVSRYNAETNRFGALETARHNQVGETQTWADISEKQRHNKASENISVATLQETSRHNRAQESIDSTLARSTVTRNDVLNHLTTAQELSEYQKQFNLSADTALKTQEAKTEAERTKYVKRQAETENVKQAEMDSERKYQDVLASQNLAGKTDSEIFRNYTGGIANLTGAAHDIFQIFGKSQKVPGMNSINGTNILDKMSSQLGPSYYDSMGNSLINPL